MFGEGRRPDVKKAILIVLAAAILAPLAVPAWAQDAGVPDTLYVEVYSRDDLVFGAPPFFVRFPIYVTNDVVDPVTDSIAGFVLPLCYEVQPFGPVDYCSLGVWWNDISMVDTTGGEVQQNRSIFRHLPSMQDIQIHNKMLDMNADFIGGWNFVVLDLGDEVSRFWFTTVPTGTQDQRWGPGSRSLLATITFKMDFWDSAQVCIDTCFWPPSQRFAFSNSNAETYIPQNFFPVCQTITMCPGLVPYFTMCPGPETPHHNGTYSSGEFQVRDDGPCAGLADVSASFTGTGVSNVRVVAVKGDELTGHVDYVVADHCQAGGTVQIMATDIEGIQARCEFDIVLVNNAPDVSAPDSFSALALMDTVEFSVSAVDEDVDPIGSLELGGFWLERDSLQPPSNSPSFDGENPGLFMWTPQAADTGIWICSFSVADTCGAIGTKQTIILVEQPPPPVVYCPEDQSYDGAGYYYSYFQAESPVSTIEDIWCGFTGQGVENVLFDGWGLGTPYFDGAVEYDVTDYCQAGGTVTVIVTDHVGHTDTCTFDITLNQAPHVNLPDTLLAIAGATRLFQVSAADPNGETVEMSFDGMWYQPDSLRSPTNPPFFDGGNPGLFTWVPTEGEEGAWICSFSAADVCGAAGSSRTTILVGPLFCGDSAPGEIINVADVIYLLNYLYAGGPAPNPICKGDANCDGITNVADAIMLLNYLFRLGTAPCFGCCPE
jgi:hypothetical protein